MTEIEVASDHIQVVHSHLLRRLKRTDALWEEFEGAVGKHSGTLRLPDTSIVLTTPSSQDLYRRYALKYNDILSGRRAPFPSTLTLANFLPGASCKRLRIDIDDYSFNETVVLGPTLLYLHQVPFQHIETVCVRLDWGRQEDEYITQNVTATWSVIIEKLRKHQPEQFTPRLLKSPEHDHGRRCTYYPDLDFSSVVTPGLLLLCCYAISDLMLPDLVSGLVFMDSR